MTAMKDLLGTWELMDWRVFADGVFHKFPMGEDAMGQLIYTDAGIMSGFLMRADYKDEPPRSPAAAIKCLSYAGTFHIDEDEVHHQVTLSTIPEWIGGPLVRTMEWRGEQLLLKTDPEIGKDGKGYSNELLWRRRTSIF